MIAVDDGVPAPLGAHFDGRGVNFALFSEHATAVDICLFEPGERHETRTARLPCPTLRKSANCRFLFIDCPPKV